MADVTKAQKLAAARKMLKEYKHKSKSTKKQETMDAEQQSTTSQVLAESLTSSTHSSFNGQMFTSDVQAFDQPNHASSPLQNYFNNASDEVIVEKPNNFFDSISNYESVEDFARNNSFNDYFNTSTYLNEQQYNSPPKYFVDEGVIAMNYPDIKQNEIYELHNQNKTDDNANSKSQNKLSSVESLRQLSSQIAQIVDSNSEYDYPSTITELEKRNQGLAGLLEEKQIQYEQLSAQLNEQQKQLAKLETELKQTKEDSESRISRELGPLQEQLQYHVQTVGILVAEKTELSSLVSQSQTALAQKNIECNELHERLKSLGSRCSELEKEISTLKAEKTNYSKVDSEHNNIVEQLKSQLQAFNYQKEETAQDLLETREKLKSTSNENLNLRKQIHELSSQLSLANIKVQQITAGESFQTDTKIETLTQEKLTLEQKVNELNQALKTTTKERDQASLQYQQYVQQLNVQITNLAGRLDTLTQENETLANRERDLVKHIGELDKHLQTLQNERVAITPLKNHEEFETALEQIKKLQSEQVSLQEDLTRVLNVKEMLLKDLNAKQESIAELEGVVERLQGNQPDTTKLLATMESNQIAAARAVSQNQELKERLQEMDEVFIKMTNDKMELTEKLMQEKRLSKDLEDRVHQYEGQLHTLSDAIAIKDRELTQIRESSSELNKQVLQQSQLTDRLRHYEAQDNSSHSLQMELQEAKQLLIQLKEENSKLKNEETSLQVFTLKRKVDELEQINKTLELQLNKLANNENTTEENLKETKEIINKDRNDNEEINKNILDKEAAMKHLEEKFLRTMQDIANLTEEKQRLEHIVLQLQGETETIGEYIALYQHQRGILRQRALEKDEQLKQLANDREMMKNKLEQLNNLVKQLVLEKGALTADVLQQHEILNRESHELCEEHAKIHQEINKIAQENINGDRVYKNNDNSETAAKIIELLSEIKTSNLVQPSENFHPCPWCSGKLITV